MRFTFVAAVAALALIAGCTSIAPSSKSLLAEQVADTERAFAKTMADRNFEAFQLYLSDEAVFFTRTTALRGKPAIVSFWRRFYEPREAPFSWAPQEVHVLDSGTLAISFGPVRDPSGKHFANFQSVWRLEAPGVWKIIFDRGSDQCEPCAKQ